jgi:hypothetical protein
VFADPQGEREHANKRKARRIEKPPDREGHIGSKAAHDGLDEIPAWGVYVPAPNPEPSNLNPEP